MSGPAESTRTWLEHGGRRYAVAAARGVSLAIPLDPHGAQPSHFSAPPARAEPLAAAGFIGDTRAGGSCNCETITLVPHCNGTHTEGPGHLTDERLTLQDQALRPLYLAVLVSIAAEVAATSGETTRPTPQPGDYMITARALRPALAAIGDMTPEAVVLRTLPNDPAKCSRDWMSAPLPPYFSHEAMALLVERRVRHLLVDLPSVDRLLDEGRLAAHRVFFGMPPEGRSAATVGRPDSTITEMIFVPDALPDGLYALALQLAPWLTDAVPARPLLFPLEAE